MHIIAAKAICFGEALKPEFKEYQQQVIKNAKALAQAMIDGRIQSGKWRNRQSSDVSGSAEYEYHRKRTAEQTG